MKINPHHPAETLADRALRNLLATLHRRASNPLRLLLDGPLYEGVLSHLYRLRHERDEAREAAIGYARAGIEEGLFEEEECEDILGWEAERRP